MGTPTITQITPLLVNWRQGDEKALADLLPIVYQELRKIADSYLRLERSDHTMQPTALINEEGRVFAISTTERLRTGAEEPHAQR